MVRTGHRWFETRLCHLQPHALISPPDHDQNTRYGADEDHDDACNDRTLHDTRLNRSSTLPFPILVLIFIFFVLLFFITLALLES